MDIWRQKILAYLHDPAFKPWYLPWHVKRAAEIASVALREKISEKDLEQDRRPDYIASAAERLNFSKGIRASFTSDPQLRHVLSGYPFAIDEYGIKDVGSDRESWDAFKKLIMSDPKNRVLHRAMDACMERVKEFKKDGVSDQRAMFIRLWRCLAEDLERGKGPFGLLWRFMPADTRIPDHSIWDHVRLASAVAGCLAHGDRMAFLLVKVGPVQPFIAESRKARDLWAASYIVSVLSGTAMTCIASEMGPDNILYPDMARCAEADWLFFEKFRRDGDGSWLKRLWEPPDAATWPITTASLPAAFVALVPADLAVRIGKAARQAALDAWKEIAGGVHGLLGKWTTNTPWKSGWDQGWDSQIEGVFDIKYAVLPWPETPVDLKDGKKGVIGAFAALKTRLRGGELPEEIWINSYTEGSTTGPNAGNLYGSMHEALRQRERSRGLVHCFDQHRGDSREKCTLCGRREAMGPVDSRRQLRQFWGELQKRRGNRVVLKPDGAERLCASCAVKRFVWQAGLKDRLKGFVKCDPEHISRFPSTATIAAVPFLQLLAKAITSNKQIQKDAKEHLKAVRAFMEGVSCSLPSRPAVACLCPVHYELDSEVRDIISLDGEFFLPERFEPETVRLEYGDGLEDEAKTCSESISKLQKVLQKVGAPARPSSYLGLVTLDGDHVGRWVSGRSAPNLREIIHPQILEDEEQRGRLQEIFKGVDLEKVLDKPRPNCPALQAAISRALRDFSQYAAREAVKGHGMGRLIYAGGDELLAFTPGATALMTAHRLRAYYSGAMEREGEGWAPDLNRVDEPLERPLLLPNDTEAGPLATMGLKATATAAIVLFHALSSLGTAITEGRTAMGLAKGFPGGNALAISVLKRSGEAIRLVMPWRVLESDPGSRAGERPLDVVSQVLNPLVQAMAIGDLSRNLVYHLVGEAETIAADPAARAGFEAWLCWQLARHSSEASCLAPHLSRLACAMSSSGDDQCPGACLIDILGVARFLAGIEMEEEAGDV